jgi:hypothetical protein
VLVSPRSTVGFRVLGFGWSAKAHSIEQQTSPAQHNARAGQGGKRRVGTRCASVEHLCKRLGRAQESKGEKVGGWEGVEGRAWARRHLGPAPLLLLLIALFAFLLALPLLLLPPPPTSQTFIHTHTYPKHTQRELVGVSAALCCKYCCILAYAGLCCPALKHTGLCYPPLQHAAARDTAQRDTQATGKRGERALPAQVLFYISRPFLLASVPAPPPQSETPRLSKRDSARVIV